MATKKAKGLSLVNPVSLFSGISLSPEETFSVVETILGYRYAKLEDDGQKAVGVLNCFPVKWRRELCLLTLHDLMSYFNWYSIYFFGTVASDDFWVTSINVQRNWSNNYTATLADPIRIPWLIDKSVSLTTLMPSNSNTHNLSVLESNAQGSLYLGSVPNTQVDDNAEFYYKITNPLPVTLRLIDGARFYGTTSVPLDKIELSTAF